MVGYSDHTESDIACIGAVALGASVIEKHLTLDRELPGPDQPTSLEPEEMRRLVTHIRETEHALGSGVKEPAPSEQRNIAGMRRGIVTRRAIAKGATIAAADLILKRPLSEVPPTAWNHVVGAKAARAIAAGDPLRWDDIEGGKR
jgi:N-acetylneuraminate synthase/N,N'-diacetyllegionaminate synthase